jgi:hypothetical protein
MVTCQGSASVPGAPPPPLQLQHQEQSNESRQSQYAKAGVWDGPEGLLDFDRGRERFDPRSEQLRRFLDVTPTLDRVGVGLERSEVRRQPAAFHHRSDDQVLPGLDRVAAVSDGGPFLERDDDRGHCRVTIEPALDVEESAADDTLADIPDDDDLRRPEFLDGRLEGRAAGDRRFRRNQHRDRGRKPGKRDGLSTNHGRSIREDGFVESIPPEALLEDYAPPLQEIAQRLREIVRRSAPDAIERVRPGWQLIGYDLPLGKRRAFFAWVWPEHEHVHLGFPQGWAMRDPHRVLNGRGVTKRVRWLTFTSVGQVDAAACAELLDEAIEIATMSRGERELRAMDREDAP